MRIVFVIVHDRVGVASRPVWILTVSEAEDMPEFMVKRMTAAIDGRSWNRVVAEVHFCVRVVVVPVVPVFPVVVDACVFVGLRTLIVKSGEAGVVEGVESHLDPTKLCLAKIARCDCRIVCDVIRHPTFTSRVSVLEVHPLVVWVSRGRRTDLVPVNGVVDKGVVNPRSELTLGQC